MFSPFFFLSKFFQHIMLPKTFINPMATKERDQYRRLAIFDLDGEAISTILISVKALAYAYRLREILVEVRGDTYAVFRMNLTNSVYTSSGNNNIDYPQFVTTLLAGNGTILEDLDYKLIARYLNNGLPEGMQTFKVHYVSPGISRSYSNRDMFF